MKKLIEELKEFYTDTDSIIPHFVIITDVIAVFALLGLIHHLVFV
jgi:hypothetical protein